MDRQARLPRAKPRRSDTNGTFPEFAKFLRRYMSVWPVLLACLIGPIAKYLHLLPIYKDHENLLASLTALYGLLLAAALFYYRPAFLQPKRSRRSGKIAGNVVLLLPAALLVVSIGSFFRYTALVQNSIRTERGRLIELVEPSQLSAEEILARTDFANIPDGGRLLHWYLMTFLAAETSLVLMALSEYLKTKSGSLKG